MKPACKLLAFLLLFCPLALSQQQQMDLSDWGAGLWTNDDEERIPDRGMTRADNVTLSRNGQASKRVGSTRLVTGATPSLPIVEAYRFYPTTGSAQFVYSTTSALYYSGGASSATAWATSGGSAPQLAQFSGILLGVNGSAGQRPIYTRDGQNWATLGLRPPTGATLTRYSSGGSLKAGTHEYRITRRDQYGNESGPFPDYLDQAATMVADATVDGWSVRLNSFLGITPSSNSPVGIYRRGPDTGGRFYRVTILSASTGYVDTGELEDILLERLDPNDPPQGSGAVAVHLDRAWLANSATTPTRLWYSAVGNPMNWGADRYFQVDDAAGPIYALASYAGALIVFCPRAIFALLGEAPGTLEDPGLPHETPWQLLPIVRGRGCVSPSTVAEVNGQLWYLDVSGNVHYIQRTGTFQFSGSEIGSPAVSEQITDQFDEWRNDNLQSYACAVQYSGSYYLSFASATTATMNDVTFVAFTQKPFTDDESRVRVPWVKWTRGFTAFSPWTSTDDGYKIYAALYQSPYAGVVRIEVPNAYTDANLTGAASSIPLFIRSKKYDVGQTAYVMDFDRLFFKSSADNTYTARLLIDGRVCSTKTIGVSYGSLSNWGEHNWSDLAGAETDPLYWAGAGDSPDSQQYTYPRRCVGTYAQSEIYDSGGTDRLQLIKAVSTYYIRAERIR